MFRLGEPFDKNEEVGLIHDLTSHGKPMTMTFRNTTLRLSFRPIKVSEDDKKYPLFYDEGEYTFRDYGKLENFTWKNIAKFDFPIIRKSYLDRLRNSPKISRHEVIKAIIEDRVYGLELSIWRNDTSGRVSGGIMTLISISTGLVTYIYDESDSVITNYQRLLDMLGRSDVIGMYVRIRGVRGPYNSKPFYIQGLVIKVNDADRQFLNKLILIYNKLMKDLRANKISLGHVLDNIDLYYCIALGL